MEPVTFGSLFAGIGGFDLGFERAGMVCKWQVEIDDYATKVLEKHWPRVHRERDIRQCGSRNLERVDVICGGFPCQDISYAGLGAGLDGERSGLFFEAIRVVRQLQPKVVVLENVAALLTRGLDRVLGTLAEIGFDAEWHCIPAASVGAPHIRDRVFILAYAKHGRLSKRRRIAVSTAIDDAGGVSRDDRTRCRVEAPTMDTDSNSGRLKKCKKRDSKQDVELYAQQRRDAMRLRDDVPNTHITGLQKRQRKDASGTRAHCRTKPSGSEWWDIEPAVGRVAYGVPNRSHRLRCLGNAVVPQVAEYIGRQVMENFFNRR